MIYVFLNGYLPTISTHLGTGSSHDLGHQSDRYQRNPAFHGPLKTLKKFYRLYFVPTWPRPGPILLLLLGVKEEEEDGPSAGPVRAPHRARTCASM